MTNLILNHDVSAHFLVLLMLTHLAMHHHRTAPHGVRQRQLRKYSVTGNVSWGNSGPSPSGTSKALMVMEISV